MNRNRFVSRYILAFLLCIVGLASCGEKNAVPTNEIRYTAIDNQVLSFNSDEFGTAKVISNNYNPETRTGILTFSMDVTEIGDSAFMDCSNLVSIILPASVAEIGYRAFYFCENLKSIVIQESVTEIEDWAFAGCSS